MEAGESSASPPLVSAARIKREDYKRTKHGSNFSKCQERAKTLRIPTHITTNSGRTQIAPNSRTVMAILGKPGSEAHGGFFDHQKKFAEEEKKRMEEALATESKKRIELANRLEEAMAIIATL